MRFEGVQSGACPRLPWLATSAGTLSAMGESGR
jgi:hypothetical protein